MCPLPDRRHLAGEYRSELYAVMLDKLAVLLLLNNWSGGRGRLRTEHYYPFHWGDYRFLDSCGGNNSLDPLSCHRVERHAEALMRYICGR